MIRFKIPFTPMGAQVARVAELRELYPLCEGREPDNAVYDVCDRRGCTHAGYCVVERTMVERDVRG